MKSFLERKKVVVTGACGTVGRELVRQLLEVYHVGELVALDNSETELFLMEQKFQAHPSACFFLADVRDRNKLARKMKNMNIVFHTAAFKHVTLCERSPLEAVQTNILGVQNVIASATENNVERVIFTSSDKAVNPTSVMGTSKLMGERLMTAANTNLRGNGPIFASTRFGNVLGSKGSVIPVFQTQLRGGGPVTITDSGMSRFIMSVEEAVRLVIDSAYLAHGGEVFVTKMPAIRIKDLAEVMIEELAPKYGRRQEDIRIEIIGVKPGEKMYEELLSHEETRRALELKRYFVVLPAFRGLYQNIPQEYPDTLGRTVSQPYHSGNEKPMTKDQLREFLIENALLTEDLV